MKYLQIYDYNGNLSKEFPVYLEGADFNWQAPKPEAIWLGTIKLASEPSMHPIEPTPEPAPYVPPLPHVEERITLPPKVEPEVEPELEPIPEAKQDELEILARDTGIALGEQIKEEVKHEPKKRVHKGSRKSRTQPPDGAEGPEAVSE